MYIVREKYSMDGFVLILIIIMLGMLLVVGIGVLSLIYNVIMIGPRGVKEFCSLSPEDQLHYFGITDIGKTISMKSFITPNRENTSLVYDLNNQMIYFIHGRAYKNLRSFESVNKDQVLSYSLEKKPIVNTLVIKTTMINQPILRVYCVTNNVAEEIIASLDLIMSNQSFDRFGQAMLKN
jgi:hypothetical protein